MYPDHSTSLGKTLPSPKKLPAVTKHSVPSIKTPAAIIDPQRPSTIFQVLAKLATQHKNDKLASTKQELDGVEEIDEDLAFQELDKFLEEDEILEGQ